MIFSVIVPFLDEEKYIKRCIEALLGQDFDRSEYELIFVDNGSTDASGSIVSGYKDIILLREEVKGVYKARNRAIKSVRGEIIAFTDADCVVSRDWLRRIDNGMADTGASVVMGPVYFPKGGAGGLKFFEDYQNAKIEYVIKKGLKKFYYGYTNNMAFKADVFRKLGPFSEGAGVSGDTEMVHRCLAGYPDCKVAYLEGMKVEHLEISGLGVYRKKMYAYGRDSVLVNKACRYVSLGPGERLEIYRYSCMKNRYGIHGKIASFLVLIGMFFYFECGRLLKKCGI